MNITAVNNHKKTPAFCANYRILWADRHNMHNFFKHLVLPHMKLNAGDTVEITGINQTKAAIREMENLQAQGGKFDAVVTGNNFYPEREGGESIIHSAESLGYPQDRLVILSAETEKDMPFMEEFPRVTFIKKGAGIEGEPNCFQKLAEHLSRMFNRKFN